MFAPDGSDLTNAPDWLKQAIISRGSASSGLDVKADLTSSDSSLRIPLQYLDPLFDQILLIFPQDNLRELNRRLRHYYKYDPYIRSIVDFHTETPLSDFDLRCPANREVEEYFQDFKDRKNLLNTFVNVLRDYWLLGEGFAYGNWDADNREFSEFVQLPPEELEIHSAYISTQKVYVMRPNKEVAKMMRSFNPADTQVSDIIRHSQPQFAAAVARNKPFILDTNRLFIMQREQAGYINRGISPVLAVVKDLIYQDFLNMYRTTFIQRHAAPLRLFKLGSAEKGFIPSKKMFREFRAQLVQAINDPDFNFVTHPFVQVEYHTGQDKILNLIPMYDLVKTRIFAGLFVSEAVISGEKTPYAAGVTFMRGLMNRYLTVRNMLEIEVQRKIFSHLSRKRGFYMPTQAETSHRIRAARTPDKLIMPKIMWHKANLLANQQIQQLVIGLREKGEIPFRFVAEMFGWNMEDIAHQLAREESTPADQAWRKVRDKALADDEMLANKVLSGVKLDVALKEQIVAKFKTGDKSEKGKEDKEKKPARSGLTPPEVPISRPSLSPETEARPSEVKSPIPPMPGTPGESASSKPRPGEEGGAGAGGAAGGTP